MKRVSVRLSPERYETVEELAGEFGSKSAVLRRGVVELADDDPDDDTDDDAAERGYQLLVNMVGVGGIVSLEAARAHLADELNQPKDTIRTTVFEPLRRSDRIELVQTINDVTIVVR
jgi:Arc/MetJ-type ribon-helix-helix transcriptional regulator